MKKLLPITQIMEQFREMHIQNMQCYFKENRNIDIKIKLTHIKFSNN